MRKYAPKHQESRMGKSGDAARPGSTAARSHGAHLILHLQRTVGNQAVQRLLQAEPDGRGEVPNRAGFARVGHTFSRKPVDVEPSDGIQSKLAVNAPGDIYEQEADLLSQQVMMMSEAQLRPVYARGGGLPGRQAEQPVEEHEQLQIRRVQAGDKGQSAAPSIVHEVLAEPGQPLESSTRDFMEPRFGYDFGNVRVHADAKAAQSACEVNALAYTAGRDVVFGAGQYQPNTGAGRQLLAHELSHAIQQGYGMRHRIQRAMKFEFQTTNEITTNKGRKLGRKFGKFLHKGKTGVRLETDTGGVAEFETGGWKRKWSKLRKLIQEAVDIVTEINKDPKAFPFSEEQRLTKEGFLKKGEKLEVNVMDKNFSAKIQSSEGLVLSQYESFLREHEKPKFIDPVVQDAQSILDDARKANKSIKSTTKTDNLRGFLQVIVNYITRAQEVVSHVDNVSPVKAKFRLMQRTNFSSVFSSLLSPEEQTLFRQIVKSNAIPLELGITATDPLFNGGFWGHSDGMMALFEGGKIVALATEDQDNILDCKTGKMTKGTNAKGIDKGMCGKKVPASEITVGAWLHSIVGKKMDLLSPPHGGSAAMGGEGDVRTKGKHKGLVRFETRGSEAKRLGTKGTVRPASDWVDFVEEVFLEAATCRPRPGKAGLEYDGSKTFDPKKCP